MRLIQSGAIPPLKQDELQATLAQAGVKPGTPEYDQATMSALRADAHMEQPQETITRKTTAATSLVDKGIATNLNDAMKMVDSIEKTGKLPEGVKEGLNSAQMQNSYTLLNMAIQTHDPKALSKWAASVVGTPLEGLVDPTKQPIEWEKLDEMKKQTALEAEKVGNEAIYHRGEVQAAMLRAGLDLKKEENAKMRGIVQDLYTMKRDKLPVPAGLEKQAMDYFAEYLARSGQSVEKVDIPGLFSDSIDYIYHDLVNSQALSDIEDLGKVKDSTAKPATPTEIQGLLQQNRTSSRVGGGLR
jgi:hypothetical protein